jgi:hypothetical protein
VNIKNKECSRAYTSCAFMQLHFAKEFHIRIFMHEGDLTGDDNMKLNRHM